MPTVYSIRDWDKHFEVSQTRKVDTLRWIPVPVKHDGLGFRRVMALVDGLSVFGAWNLILQVAGKCKQRGLLTADTGRPLTAQDIAIKTGAPAKAIERALQVLSSDDVGWIVVDDSSGVESDSTSLDLSRGEDRTGQESASADSSGELSAVTEFVFPTTGKGAKQWTLSQAKFDEYVASYPGLDVAAEMRRARQWCRDKSRQRKTARGMPAFLTGWLNRAQNKGAGRNGEATQGYEKVTVEEFRQCVAGKQFKDGPFRSKSDQCWVYGTLNDGRKVDCRNYPAKQQATPTA